MHIRIPNTVPCAFLFFPIAFDRKLRKLHTETVVLRSPKGGVRRLPYAGRPRSNPRRLMPPHSQSPRGCCELLEAHRAGLRVPLASDQLLLPNGVSHVGVVGCADDVELPRGVGETRRSRGLPHPDSAAAVTCHVPVSEVHVVRGRSSEPVEVALSASPGAGADLPARSLDGVGLRRGRRHRSDEATRERGVGVANGRRGVLDGTRGLRAGRTRSLGALGRTLGATRSLGARHGARTGHGALNGATLGRALGLGDDRRGRCLLGTGGLPAAGEARERKPGSDDDEGLPHVGTS
jgi:hypothetical protein